MDVKGRLAIPKRFRDAIQESCEGQLIVTMDLYSPCLLIYPLDEWEVIERKLLSLPNMDPQTRLVQRGLIGRASDVEMDAQGRILLPSTLRDLAKLDKSVMVIGQGNKLEVWSQAAWQEAEAEMMQQSLQEGVSSALAQLSL